MAKEDSPTRGFGLMEGFLARHRARAADRLIPPGHRGGRILDIGCGAYPIFLISTDFAEKHGLDKAAPAAGPAVAGISLEAFDFEAEGRLPYPDGYFDVVTMLAVFEHIGPARLPGLLGEIHRVLRQGGLYVMTTPAGWTAPVLRVLAGLRVVSPAEIEDHKGAYGQVEIAALLEAAGFSREMMRFGHFELRMNIWGRAEK